MSIMDRILLRGLQPYLPEDAEVLVLERVRADALGEQRKANVVLTRDQLLIVTPVRLKSVLTVVPLADIRSIVVLGEDHIAVGFEDYSRAIHRVIEIELRRKGDRKGLLAHLAAGPGGQEPVT
jgi:hypothetical protein